MGNQSSSYSSETLNKLHKYQQISKVQQGVIYALKSVNQSTSEEVFSYYLLKEHHYPNETVFLDAYQRYQLQVQANKNQSNSQSNTLCIREVVKQQIQNFCSNTYKIYTLYDYPQLTLRDQIQVRAREKKYFEECELIAILQTCIMALQEIQVTISFSPKLIFISQDGIIKTIHNDLVDEGYRHLISDKIYYAPEKLYNFTHQTTSEVALKKQIIFSIGMTILEACCLQELYQIYDLSSRSINEVKLQSKICNIAYSNQLIELLTNMLQINPNRRISLLEVQRALSRYDDQANDQLDYNELQPHRLDQDNQIIQNEGDELQDKCDELFQPQSKRSLSKINQSMQSADQPSVPNLLSHQNSSRLSMNRPSCTKLSKLPFNELHQSNKQHTMNSDSYLNRIKEDSFYHRSIVNNHSDDLPQNQTANFSLNYNQSTERKNQNLFTDPKLLEMIRRDLEEINKSRTSRMSMIGSQHSAYSGVKPYQTNNQTNSITTDYKPNRFESSTKQYLPNYEYLAPRTNEFVNLNNCPHVQSLAASIAMDDSNRKTFVYEESSVKDRPEQNMAVSVALSTKNFNQQNENNIASKPSENATKTVRYPLKEVSTNNNLNFNKGEGIKSFSQIEDDIKKQMMKKKESNLVYLEEVYQDGVKYEGMSKNGLKQGYGKLIYSDGAYYEGYFHGDKINGKGILYYQKSRPAYDGEWLDEQFNGYGQLYNQQPEQLQQQFPYHNFNFLENYWVKYEGEFIQDNKHGHGKIILSSDQYIEGQFKDDMLNGWGKFYRQDGTCLEGRWENNILVELKNE